MNSEERKQTNKGGRPRKPVRRDQQLALMCNQLERKQIEMKAKAAGLSVSEFLRNLALKNQTALKMKTLPKEVLEMNGTLRHMAANLNQLAKRKNRGELLDALDRIELVALSEKLKQIPETIQNFLR